MEKVRTGDLFTSSNHSFTNVTYYKQKEVVKPYLHWLDDKALKKAVKAYFSDKNQLSNRVHTIMTYQGYEYEASADDR